MLRQHIKSEGFVGTVNAHSVVAPIEAERPNVESIRREVFGEITPFNMEPGFGSTSEIVDSSVTFGTIRVSRGSATSQLSEIAREMSKRLSALADALQSEAATLSKMRLIANSPTFVQLEEAGSAAISTALARLMGDSRPLWLYFLQQTTHERPAANRETIESAADAWLAWGHRSGLL